MRINKFVARATGLSRRAADAAIQNGRVTINQRTAALGDNIDDGDTVNLDGQPIIAAGSRTVMLNKPAGYVCSRDGQGGRTIYELLPLEYHRLKPVGRLDKDSSGLLLLTDDGDLANRLAHPRYAKAKVYEISLGQPLAPNDRSRLDKGISVEDYVSRLQLKPLGSQSWQVTMSQGRNRQIRRTFAALGYDVKALHRTAFGPYQLSDLPLGQYHICDAEEGL
ncbi:MAG TPA: pseudouridine synthase [Candidatus Saccharimonadales bacterium]